MADAMGASQSRGAPEAEQPKGFHLRVCGRLACVRPRVMRLAHAIGALPPQVSQQLLEKTGVVPEPVASAGESNQTEQRAFDQGAEQAQQEQAQYQAEQGSIDRQLQLEAMQRANDEHEQRLRERIEELQRREYRHAAECTRTHAPALSHLAPCHIHMLSWRRRPKLSSTLALPHRAPVKPLACKEEREAALACYRQSRGGAPGDIVANCAQVSDELEKCAALVREAAMSKIVAGSSLS